MNRADDCVNKANNCNIFCTFTIYDDPHAHYVLIVRIRLFKKKAGN